MSMFLPAYNLKKTYKFICLIAFGIIFSFIFDQANAHAALFNYNTYTFEIESRWQHTKRTYEYDDRGYITGSIRKEMDNGTWVNELKTENNYDVDKETIIEYKYKPHTDTWEKYEKTEYIYGNDGKRIEGEIGYYWVGYWEKEEEAKYHYDENGNVFKMEVFYYAGDVPEKEYESKFEYNADNLLIKQTQSYFDNGRLDEKMEGMHKYDSKNRIKEISSFIIDNGEKRQDYKSVFDYVPGTSKIDKNMIYIYQDEENDWLPAQKDEYIFDTDSRLQSKTTYNNRSNSDAVDWEEWSKRTYEFTNKGNSKGMDIVGQSHNWQFIQLLNYGKIKSPAKGDSSGYSGDDSIGDSGEDSSSGCFIKTVIN